MKEGLESIAPEESIEPKKDILAQAEIIRDEIKNLNPGGLPLDKMPNDVLAQILVKYKKMERVVLSKENSKELLESFESAKEHWLSFYQEYGIDTSSIENIKLTDAGMEKQRELAEKYDFDKILIIPAGISPSDLVDNKKFIVFSGSEKENQNTKDENDPIYYGDSAIKSSKWFTKKLDKPQVIFLKNKGHVDTEDDQTIETLLKDHPELFKDKDKPTTRNHTYPQIVKMEESLGIEGLDFIQAMILDRENFNNTGHHSFDYRKNNAVWVTKTKDKIKAGRCAGRDWSPGHRQFKVNLWDDSFAYGSLGSVFSRSLECVEE